MKEAKRKSNSVMSAIWNWIVEQWWAFNGKYIVRKHLWVYIMWILPIALLIRFWNWLQSLVPSTAPRRTHEEKVRRVQEQIEQWIAMGKRTPMCSSRPSWKSITPNPLGYKNRLYGIEIDLPDILEIDEEAKFVRVEPMISIGELNDFLIAKGWTLPIVPELDDLTIGGLVMGGGIESTSHVHGLFDAICLRLELIMADGSIQVCSRTENPELYHATFFSYGTLGFLASVDLQIVPFKPYIKLTYRAVREGPDAVAKEMIVASNNPNNDSVEGIVYSKDTAVIMTGDFVDSVPRGESVNRIGLWYKPWFYKHCKSFLRSSKSEMTEYIPTFDFFHRHNRPIFWVIRHVFPFGNNPIYRFFFGWVLPVKFSHVKRMREWIMKNWFNNEDPLQYIFQDFIYHEDALKDGLALVDKHHQMYPIWLCPAMHKAPSGNEDLVNFRKPGVYYDVGVYGYAPNDSFDLKGVQQLMEKHCNETDSFVATYAETFLTREEHAKMFKLDNYEYMRKKYQCEGAFPHIYDKISKEGRKP